MVIKAIKTSKLHPREHSLLDVLEQYIDNMPDSSILAITSKVVAICEGRVVPLTESNKDQLVIKEADQYVLDNASKHKVSFTITKNTLIPAAGIDESNGDGHYVLWPKDAQATANEIRAHLRARFGLKNIGVIITDSTCTPLRYGTTGISLAHSGFQAINDYQGKADLFGRPLKLSQSNIAGGLAAAAVLVMGEGSEQTPFALLTELKNIQWHDHDPTPEELSLQYVEPQNDLFEPFLKSANWLRGQK